MKKAILAVILGMSSVCLAEEAETHAPSTSPSTQHLTAPEEITHPTPPASACWVRPMATGIGVMFVAAAVIGMFVRTRPPVEQPHDDHGHDDHGASHGHH